MLFDELRKAKTDFYNLMYNPQVSDSSVNKAADLIAENQKTLDLQMLIILRWFVTSVRPDQLQKFDTYHKKSYYADDEQAGKRKS